MKRGQQCRPAREPATRHSGALKGGRSRLPVIIDGMSDSASPPPKEERRPVGIAFDSSKIARYAGGVQSMQPMMPARRLWMRCWRRLMALGHARQVGAEAVAYQRDPALDLGQE